MATFRSRQPNAAHYDVLPPEKAVAARPTRPSKPLEVVDADFVVIRDARPRTAGFRYNDNQPPKRPASSVKVEVSRLARAAHALSQAERFLRRVPERAFSALVAVLFIGVFGLAGGFYGIAGASAPGPTDLKPLDITHVSLTPQDADGMRVLLVNGIVENRSIGAVTVPSIRADLVSGGRLLASTIIEAPAAVIDGGHSRGFSARLPHPGGKNPDIRLSFTEPGVSQP